MLFCSAGGRGVARGEDQCNTLQAALSWLLPPSGRASFAPGDGQGGALADHSALLEGVWCPFPVCAL
jgi:hypothetical protein